jgi:AAA domain, putative AbiEii toxin, Type IV TA system
MSLRSVRLRNYRAFVREVTVSLRPLTLLFGYNSAGKSALLRALPLIAESVRSTSGPLALRGDAAGRSTFRDVRTRWAAGDQVSFGLDWAEPDASLDVEIVHLAASQREIIGTMRLRDAVQGELRFEIDLADERAADITQYTLDGERGRIRFEGWCAAEVSGFVRPEVARRLEGSSAELRRFSDSVHWLGALRSRPERLLPLVGSTSRIGPDGAGTIEVLARESLASSSDVLEVVSGWFENATRHVIDIRQQAGSGGVLFHLELRPLRAPQGVHLNDTGDGMNQVLPVITLGALAMRGRLGSAPLLAIEQPELHMHPRAHAGVAEYLVSVSQSATVVVETHSENFLLAVQIAILEGRLRAEDVVIHWVRGTDEGPSFVETITIDEKARPSAWPPGVFAEDRDLARRLVERRHGLSPS